jgi:hypothetical protein
MAKYKPKPLDTSKVVLRPEQRALIEKLAANAHEVWAAKRLADGWTLGPERNDAAKTHPCLIPYAALPESEKDYDRVLVEQALSGAIALGWRVEKT